MPTTAARRALTFATLDQIMPDVDRLMERGHSTVGKWTLAQICHHLAVALDGSVQGIPLKAPWLLRMTIAPIILRQLLKTFQITSRASGTWLKTPYTKSIDRSRRLSPFTSSVGRPERSSRVMRRSSRPA